MIVGALVMMVLVAVLMVMVMLSPAFAVASGDGLGRGQDEPAGLDPLGADQVVGQVADLPRRAAEQDHFEAAVLVEMDVGGGDDPVEMMVLQVGQPRARSAPT